MSSLIQQLVLSGRLSVPVILQSESAECGLACLAMVAARHGNREGLASLRARFGIGVRGSTLNQLISIGNQIGMTTRALRCELTDLGELDCPAILHWDFTHFVVLVRMRRGRAVIHDPAVGVLEMPLAEVGNHFTGIALEMAPGPAFTLAKPERVPTLKSLLTGLTALVPFLLQILVLSVLLQIVALALPFYMQIVVDDVLAKRDADLLTLLAVGFGLITCFSLVTEAIRGYAGIYLTNQLSYLLGARLFQHLMRLPADFFHRRQVGDIVSRFGSLKPVQDFITGSSITVVLDGLMAITTLTLMTLYSPMLTMIVVVAMGIYLGIQLALYSPLKHRNHEAIAAEARADTYFIETIRSMNVIKRFGIESGRNSDWQNRQADTINARVRSERLALWVQLADSAVTGLSHVVVVYAGARIVLAGDMTIGMLYAFLAYRNHLTNAVTSLINELVRYLMLSLHLERLADLQLAEPEPEDQAASRLPVKGGLAMTDAGFRYSTADPWIFRHVSLSIQAGESVAIHAPSGCGKSTLMSCLQRNLRLTEGDLKVDGKPATRVGHQAIREATAAVMQDDRLLAGTLMSNIAFGDTVPVPERARAAAKIACIHDEIAEMPMGYDSLVGEMGASMSAGQIQRVLIARALYRQPTILFLDEGTAHLDPATERQVMKNILALGMTCVFITHNRASLALADRVLLGNGEQWQMRRVRRHKADCTTRSRAA